MKKPGDRPGFLFWAGKAKDAANGKLACLADSE